MAAAASPWVISATRACAAPAGIKLTSLSGLRLYFFSIARATRVGPPPTAPTATAFPFKSAGALIPGSANSSSVEEGSKQATTLSGRPNNAPRTPCGMPTV